LFAEEGMTAMHTRQFLTAITAVASLALLEGPGDARAQLLPGAPADGAAKRILEALSVATEGEQLAEANHRTLARWLWLATQDVIKNAMDGLPNAAFLDDCADARWYLERKDGARAAARLRSAQGELAELAEVWAVGPAGEKLAEVLKLAESGDSAALAGIESLASLVRIDPAQTFLENARTQLSEAMAKNAKGYEREALRAAGEAKQSLRSAYLATRLVQVRILTARARLLAQAGSRHRAGWLLGRAGRRLDRGRYMVDGMQSSAIDTIAADISTAREMLRGGKGDAPGKLAEIEAKLTALLAAGCPQPGR
jgi:hypothetical protein